MYRPFLALRYLLSRPINLLGVLGVSLGVWAMIVVVSIFSGFLRVVGEHVRSASADVSVLQLDDARYGELRRAIEADENVAATAPRLVHYGLLHRPDESPPPPPLLGRGALQGGDTPFLFLLGVDPECERSATGFSGWLQAVGQERRVADPDHPFARIDGLPAVLLGEDRMVAGGLHRGDRVVLHTGRLERGPDGSRALVQVTRQDPAGNVVSPVFAVAGAYRTQHVGYDGNNAFVHIDELRALLDLPQDAVQEIAVKVIDRAATAATAERVTRTVRRVQGYGNVLPSRGGPIAVSWRERHGAFLDSVEWQRGLMKLVLIIIMVAAVLLMVATLSMMVTEKTADIGILTALGGSPRGVMTVFLSCGLAITIVGIALGLVSGSLSAVYLEEFRRFVRAISDIDLFPVKVYNLDRVPHELDPWWMLQVAGIALLVGVVVSALPAWRAARHDPLVSLRGT